MWDEEGFYTNQKCYIATGLPKWGVAVMNSSLMFVLAAAMRLSEKQGGFLEWEKTPMSPLPIVEPQPETATLLQDLVHASAGRPGSQDDAINNLVEEVYGVTEDEAALLADWRVQRAYLANEEAGDD